MRARLRSGADTTDYPPIDPAERARRQRDVSAARTSVRRDGFILDDDIEAISRRYVEGEPSGDEHVAAIQAAVGVGPANGDRPMVDSPTKIAAGLTGSQVTDKTRSLDEQLRRL